MAERVGRYVIDRLLARGGMAEVFLARAEGPGGFSKNVVIKRILPELAQDSLFVEMFLNEARLAARLNHPNIVQVFDFGQHDGVYYLAMEYIEGETLRAMCRAVPVGESFDAGLAVKAIQGVCEGLSYAHSLCDEHGASCNIVHRDVSPDNILVATTGLPRVLDFGIAKATSSSVPTTKAGSVKGKYAYMSPEQIRGEGLDRRVDVYAVGVTLYELLAGRRPYRGDNELHLLNSILKGQPEPLEAVRPAAGPELSKIVATAMHADKAQRYADCRVLQSALDEWLASRQLRVSWVDLAAAVERASEVRRRHRPSNVSTGPRGVPGFPLEGAQALSPAPGKTVEMVGAATATTPTLSVVLRRSRASTVATLATLTVVAAGGAMVIAWLSESTPAEPATRSADALGAVPTTVTPAVPSPAPSPTPPVAPFEPTPPESPALRTPVGTARAATGEGFLTVRSEPWCEVWLDGELLGSTPLTRSPLAAGRHTIELRNEALGARRRVAVVVIANQEHRESIVFPTGTLYVDAPDGTEVAIDGKPAGRTPLDPITLVEGTHQVLLINGGLNRRDSQPAKVRGGARQLVSVDW